MATKEEYYKNLNEVLNNFGEDAQERFAKSALFHRVTEMMVRGVTPYQVITELINVTEDTQKAFERYIITDTRPIHFTR